MPPLVASAHAYGVIAFTVLAFFLFTRERIPIPVTSLFVVAGLALGFHLFPYAGPQGSIGAGQIFSAFGHEALVAICSLMILGRALMVTGALEPVARVLARLWALSHVVATLALLAVAMGLSMVINDTPVVVILMPVVIGLALRAGGSASKMLMPMNFAVIIGGMATTIGTSTNLLIVSIANDMGVRPIGLFEFTPLVVGPAALALLYLWLIAPRLLPERAGVLAELAPRRFDAVLYIGSRSAARGRTVNSVRRMTGNRMQLQRVLRGAQMLAAAEELEITEGDRLFVNDTSAYLKDYERSLGATLFDSQRIGDLPPEHDPHQAPEQQMVEVVVTEESPLHHRRLKDARFAERFGVVILAMYRPADESSLDGEIPDRVLRSGDVLLVQGPPARVAALKNEAGVLVLDGTLDLPRTRKAPVAVLIMAAAVALAGFKVLPIAISSLIGVLALIVTRCLKFEGSGTGHQRGSRARRSLEHRARPRAHADRRRGCARRRVHVGRRWPLAAGGPRRGDGVSRRAHQLRVEQRRGGDRNTHSSVDRAADRRPARALHPRRDRRLQPLLRDADGLPDQRADHAAGRLRLPRFRTRRRAAGAADDRRVLVPARAGLSDLTAAVAARPLGRGSRSPTLGPGASLGRYHCPIGAGPQFRRFALFFRSFRELSVVARITANLRPGTAMRERSGSAVGYDAFARRRHRPSVPNASHAHRTQRTSAKESQSAHASIAAL